MKDQHSICLILPYFGRFPNYFPFWLTSCGYNSTIDYLVFTDDRTRFEYPKNMHVEYCSFAEFRKLLQSTFDFTISLDRPYKLCDFKPVYGLALEKWLKGYAFWGHVDCDMLFGNLRNFLAESLLDSYDKFFSRGWLVLYRNNDVVNRLWMQSPKCHEVFSSPKSYLFDEGGGMTSLANRLLPGHVYEDTIGYDIEISKKPFTPSQRKWREEDRGRKSLIFQFSHGHVFRLYLNGDKEIASDEVGLVHFQKRPIDVLTSNRDEFLFVPNRFIDYERPTVSALRKWGEPRGVYWHYYNMRFKNMRKKIFNRWLWR